jgi:hypothetical protein
LRERQRRKKHPLHDAEHRGVGPNTQCQRKKAYGCETWGSPQLPQRVAHVLPQTLKRCPSPFFVCLTFEQRRIAEGAEGCIAGLVWRQAAFALLFLFEVEVGAQLTL